MMSQDTQNSPSGIATLSDVAREAGVSLATASRVLNGSTRRVADSYRRRVEAAAERLGYSPNLSAQATARGTSAVIALLVADIADPYFAELASGVAEGADEAGLIVTIGITGRDEGREVGVVRALRGQRPRALVLGASRMGSRMSPELRTELELVASFGGRAVVLGDGEGIARSVLIDNWGGASELGAALAGIGYRDAVVLAGREGLVTSDDRVAGFADGFRSGGGNEPTLYRGSFDREGGIALMERVLAAGVEPGTLIFGVSDVMAIGAVHAIRAAGREVGTDLAVAGFDDVAAGRDLSPALTTVHVPLDEVGLEAFRAAVDEDWDPSASSLRLEVLLRDSSPPRV